MHNLKFCETPELMDCQGPNTHFFLFIFIKRQMQPRAQVCRGWGDSGDAHGIEKDKDDLPKTERRIAT